MLKEKYNGYKVEIKGFIKIFKCEYYDTSNDVYNQWDMDKKTLYFESLEKENLLEIKNAVLNVLNDVLFDKNADKNKNIYFYNDKIEVYQLATKYNSKPSENEIDAWYDCEICLFEQNIFLSIYINGKKLEFRDLKLIMSL